MTEQISRARARRTVYTTYFLICIFLFSITSGPVFINSWESIFIPPGQDTTQHPLQPKLHVATYGFGGGYSDAEIKYIADNFDILIQSINLADRDDEIKEQNSDIMILIYRDIIAMLEDYEDWPLVDPHEDWFLHDVDGNRLISKKFGWYLMDPGHPGWRDHYSKYVKYYLDKYPAVDGVFADDCWKSFHDSWNMFTVPDDKFPPEIAESWREDMIGMLRFVKQRIGDKLLIPNTQDKTEYYKHSDGVHDEGFVHADWQEADEFYEFGEEVGGLANISNSGKYYLALSRVSEDTDPSTKAKIGLFCFSTYLLAAEEKASFGFSDGYNEAHFETWFHPIYDSVKRLGHPINDYYMFDSVYTRDFVNGKVIVNPSTDAYSISLDQDYITLGGEVVSSVHLDSRSGIILFKNP